jgi:hypothetical protein
MKNAKFWLIQVAMLAIVGLVFGSPVIAEPGQGVAMKNLHAPEVAQDKASEQAGFKENVVPEEVTEDAPPECTDLAEPLNTFTNQCEAASCSHSAMGFAEGTVFTADSDLFTTGCTVAP